MKKVLDHKNISPKEFSLRFRLLMSYHNLTLKDIAEATGCAVSTIGTWKNGRIPSSAAVVVKLADLFEVSVSYLLEGGECLEKSNPPSASDELDMFLKVLRA